MPRAGTALLLALALSPSVAGRATATDLSIGVCDIPGAEAATCADYDFFDLIDARNSGTPWVRHVSGDGSTLVGSEGGRPYRWIDGKAVEVPIPAGYEVGEAGVVSHDGRTVAGTVLEVAAWLGPIHFFHWGEQAGFRLLALPPNRSHVLIDMSPNGQWVVGVTDQLALDFGRAFRWEDGSIRLLAGDGSIAYATSDHTTVGYDPMGGEVRWDADGTPDTIGLGTGGTPYGISPDGHIIVGEGEGPVAFEFGALRWDDDVLTLLPGDGVLTPTEANDLSADGSLIVGEAELQTVVWQDGVMRRLADVLSDDLGVSIGGHTLSSARGVSADGRVVVGQARDASNRSGNFVAVLSPKLGLDVAPDDPTNTIRLAALETRVVVFGSDQTDVADLEVGSLAFGPAGAPADGELPGGDFNGDGHADRRFGFLLPAGLGPTDTKACLTGRADGYPFRVCSHVTVLAPAVPALPALPLAALVAALLATAARALQRDGARVRGRRRARGAAT